MREGLDDPNHVDASGEFRPSAQAIEAALVLAPAVISFIHIAVTRRLLIFRRSSEPVFVWRRRTPVRAIPASPNQEWRVPMSMKLMLSAAALVAVGATSAMAAPAFVASPYCDQAISRQACGNHFEYLSTLRARRDTSLSYMKNLDPRENQALRDGGGGGGGEAAVVAAVVAADNQYRSRTA
ncbi:hypothetical protein ACF1BQ_045875 [Bradyrhizobium sp. RDT10]